MLDNPPQRLATLTASIADRYRIERELGAGGMATVYLATDLKHDRQVAIKVLREGGDGLVEAERFHREIRMLARLRHPFILPLLDSGEAVGALFFVMPYIDGDSLRARLDREGRLPIGDALEIARQVADALHSAHGEGIVHRDVKPENILLTRSGHALLADFGIARASEATGTRMTAAGLAIGTVAYMSPEQLMGERDVDARSDVYALGCVVFEMLAGRPPFEGGNPMSVISRHLSAPPPDLQAHRPDVPPGVARAIKRALAKTPDERFASARDFAQALVITGASEAPVGSSPLTHAVAAARLSIAVLPTTNIGGDSENEWFAEGITEEMTAALARLEGLRVVSRTSVGVFRGQSLPLAEIGARLGVEFVLEGSVRRAGQRIRMTVRLIRVSEDRPLWAETFDRTLEDVFRVQDEITSRVVETITEALQLGRLRGQVPAPATHLEAYDLYLLGRHHWYQRSEAGMRRARALFEQAITLDPEYAPAYAGLADATALLASWQFAEAGEMYPSAVAAARRALELDPSLSEAHASIGFVSYNWEWDWEGAVRALRQAIALSPSNETAHRWLSGFLGGIGRYDEALPLAERARVLDPLSVLPLMNLGIISLLNDRIDEAETWFRRVVAMQPDFDRAKSFLAASLMLQAKHDEARALLEETLVRTNGHPIFAWGLGIAHSLAGRQAEARALLDPLNRGTFPAMYRGIALGLLGEEDAMFAALEQAVDERSDWMYSLSRQPWLAAWRGDPRFERVVARLALPDSSLPLG